MEKHLDLRRSLGDEHHLQRRIQPRHRILNKDGHHAIRRSHHVKPPHQMSVQLKVLQNHFS